jgi:acyl carrier protein
MDKQEVTQHVRETMAKVFNVEIGTINDAASPDLISAWDSVGQMNLIMALEDEFGISFSDQQSADLRNFELTVCIVLEILEARST